MYEPQDAHDLAGTGSSGPDPFDVETPVVLLLKVGSGDPLDPAEAERWRVYQLALADAERRRGLLGITDLGDVIRYGVTEPAMLTERIVEGELEYWYGLKESLKTFTLLHDAWQLMLQERTVVWVDKEMGKRNLGDRFKTLAAMSIAAEGFEPSDENARAAAAAVVDQFLVYCEYPTLDLSAESLAAWTLMLDARRPALICVDAQTEVLADAGLNENSGTDVERWMKGYVTPARRQGVAVVLLDHTGHSEQGRPVGSRHKGAAAKVELHFEVKSKPSRTEIGTLVITVNKNTVDAPVSAAQTYRVGGTPFAFEPLGTSSVSELLAGAEELNAQAARARIRAALEREVVRLPGQTKENLRGCVSGSTAYKDDALAFLVESLLVERREGSRVNSFLYYPSAELVQRFAADGGPLPDSPTDVGGSREESGRESGAESGGVGKSREGSQTRVGKSREEPTRGSREGSREVASRR